MIDRLNIVIALNFTTEQYVVFQILLYVEFIGFISSWVFCIVALYIIVKVPQFHRNIIGCAGNLFLAYLILSFSRLIEIGLTNFDVNKGKHDATQSHFAKSVQIRARSDSKIG